MQRLRSHFSGKIRQQRRQARNQIANHQNVPQWQRNPRYFAGFRRCTSHRFNGFKKTKNLLVNVNPKYKNSEKRLKIRLQMDEMWGRVYCKGTPCWLWHAIDHETGEIVAFVMGSREHEMLWELMCELATANIEIVAVYADNNPAYRDTISRIFPGILETGKANTQKIERKHLTFRTRLKRLARKTICYSKELEMHKIMVGLLINVLGFGLQLF